MATKKKKKTWKEEFKERVGISYQQANMKLAGYGNSAAGKKLRKAMNEAMPTAKNKARLKKKRDAHKKKTAGNITFRSSD